MSAPLTPSPVTPTTTSSSTRGPTKPPRRVVVTTRRYVYGDRGRGPRHPVHSVLLSLRPNVSSGVTGSDYRRKDRRRGV